MAFSAVRRNAIRLMVSSLLFSTGWFSLSFSFPLLATLYEYSYVLIGFIGFIGSFPFLIVAAGYTRAGNRMLRIGNIMPYIVLTFLAIGFIFFSKTLFLVLILIGSTVQAFWWVTSEISLNLLGGEKNAEKYSAGWGIPNAVVPIVSGFVVQYYGFDALFIISSVSFAIGSFFVPKYHFSIGPRYSRHVRFMYVLPLFFVGILAGFIYFIIVPVLKFEGIGYSTIGILLGIFGGASAIGYVLLNFVRDRSIEFYSVVASLLVFTMVFFGITRNVYVIAAILVVSGIGASIGMSKVLAYISETSSPRIGVFYYEMLFGLGFMTGSFGQSVLFQYYGYSTIIIMFSLPVFYIALLYVSRKRKRLSGS